LKILQIIALLLALVAVGTAVYHIVETEPNRESLFKNRRGGAAMQTLWHSYESASDTQGIVIGISGLLGLLLGVIALIKRRGPIPIITVVLALGALGIVLATKTHLFS